MGKWAEVHCVCPNRVPLPDSDEDFSRPYRNKRRLTKYERKEIEEWERTTKNMFECGHRSGVAIEFWPGDIIQLGNLIGSIFREEGSTFEVFTKVGDWRQYDDELLLIQPDEAALWQMEIKEIQRALQGCGNLPKDKLERLILEFFRIELGSRINLEERLNKVAAEMPFASIESLKRNVQQSKRPDIESTVEQITEALRDAAKLCCASIATGNPIRLMW